MSNVSHRSPPVGSAPTDDVQALLDAEEAARIAADAVLQAAITAEATTRATADTTLQNQISALSVAAGSGITVFNVVDYGATGDGVTDDSTAIRNAIAAASAASAGIVWLPSDTYSVSRDASNYYCLSIPANVTLVGSGRGLSILKQVAGIAASVRLLYIAADDVRISDLTLDGNQANQAVSEHRHGIFATTCSRLIVERVTSQNFSGDGFYLYTAANDSTFRDCYATGNIRNGLTFGAELSGCLVDGGQYTENYAQQIDSEPVGTTVADIRIAGALLDGGAASTGYALTCSGSSSTDRGSGWSIIGNTIRGTTHIVWCDDVLFSGNVVENPNDAPAVSVYRTCNRVVISDNALSLTSTTAGSEAIVRVTATSGQSPTDVVIAHNVMQCAHSDNAGVLVKAADVVVDGNVIIGAGKTYATNGGILVRANTAGMSYAIVTGNHVRNFGAFGVKVYSATGNTIDHVDISHNVFDDDQGTPTMVTGLILDEDAADTALSLTCIGNVCLGGVTTPMASWPATKPVLIGGSAGTPAIYAGNGAPTHTAAKGSVYHRVDGTVGTLGEAGTLRYVNSTGASTWVALADGPYADAHGTMYFSTPAATTLAAATPAKASGTTTSQSLAGFTMPANNRLTYTGTVTRHFHVGVNAGVTKAGGGATVGTMSIAKNGTVETGSKVTVTVQNTSDKQHMSTTWALDLATNDYIEVFLESDTGDDITIETSTVSVWE
jgi:hypothetical protein